MQEIKIKKLHANAVIPKFATDGSAGFDLVAVSLTQNHITHAQDENGKVVVFRKFGTGLAFDIPKGYVGLVIPISSISNTGQRMINSIEVIGSDYRGEVTVKLSMAYGSNYRKGDKVAQMLIVPCLTDFEFKEVEELSETERGTGGYGSTGK